MPSFPLSHASADVALRTPPGDIYISHNIDEMMNKISLIADKKAIYTAINRGARRTRDWLQTQLRRELSAREEIKQKTLRTRFKRGKKRAVSGASSLAILWIGVNAIQAHRLGRKPSWNKARGGGVKVGSRWFSGAFMVKIYSAEKKIWRRVGRERFPVIVMSVPIQKEMEEIISTYERPAALMFEQRFEHELKFALGWFK